MSPLSEAACGFLLSEVWLMIFYCIHKSLTGSLVLGHLSHTEREAVGDPEYLQICSYFHIKASVLG